MFSKMLRFNYLFTVLIMLTCPLAVFSAGASTFNFLKINTDARAEAMGGGYTALADDVDTFSINPAGLAAL